MKKGTRPETWFSEEEVIEFLPAVVEAARRSMDMLKDGTYNDYVETHLNYRNRIGVIKRSDLWKADPEAKEYAWENMDEATYSSFKSFLSTNTKDQIGRIQSFTVNDFFKACYLGYQACGYDLTNMTPEQSYLRYADGRDGGLTGEGEYLDERPGIDFDSPSAWNEWYRHPDFGSHPWEVIRGGNSTHVDLYAANDDNSLDDLLRNKEISEKEYEEKKLKAGWYFQIAGKHRLWESIKFFVALRSAGLPVILEDDDDIAAKYDGTGYIGIVPHRMTPSYCESLFPAKYGRIIDFTHIFEEEKKLLPYVEWIPEEQAELKR